MFSDIFNRVNIFSFNDFLAPFPKKINKKITKIKNKNNNNNFKKIQGSLRCCLPNKGYYFFIFFYFDKISLKTPLKKCVSTTTCSPSKQLRNKHTDAHKVQTNKQNN